MVDFEFKRHKSSNIGSNEKTTTNKFANFGRKYPTLSGNHPLNASTSSFASSTTTTNSAENDHNYLLISSHQQQILRRKSSENIHENLNGFLRVDTTFGQTRRRESFHVPLSNSASQGTFSPLSPSSSTSSSAYFSDSQTTSLSSTASQTVFTGQFMGGRRGNDKPLGILGTGEFSIRLPSFPKSKSRFLRKARQLRREREKSCEKERTPTICLGQRREDEKWKGDEKSSDEEEYDDDEYEYEEVTDEEDEEERREEDEIEGIEVTVTQYSAFEAEAMPKRLPIPKLHSSMIGRGTEERADGEEESAEEMEESDEEEEEDAYSDKYSNGFLSDRSNRSSMSRSTSVTLCLPLPQSELPPSGAHYHHFHQQFRHSSPIERLVVDEVHFTFRMFNKTDSPKSSPRESVAQNNVGQGGNISDENRSPRWRGDSHYEAILPGKKEQLQKLQKTPEVIIERREPIPRTLKTAPNQQKDSTISSSTLLNGNLNNKNDQKALAVATSSPSPSTSSVTAVISSSQRKLPDDEFVISASNKNAESKAVDKIAPPPCYQQAAVQKKTTKIVEEDLDLEKAYANAIRRSRIAGKLSGMPKFHFPLGKPIGKVENDKRLSRIRELFESNKAGQLPMEQFDELCRRMDFAVYTKRAVYDACCRLNGLPVQPVLLGSSPTAPAGTDGQEQQQEQMPEIEPIDFNQFCVYWNRMISEAHDEASRFVFTLNAASSRYSPTEKSPQSALYLLKEDFLPMMMDLILTHPGLHFLKDAPQFYSKYCEVVIVRIFWNANRSWTGRLTGNELRRSNFLQTLRLLEEVTDINKVTEYFSYEHFYVTYCKFWELDTDHDMVISRDDMRRHCNGALPDRIIDRIFSAAVIRTPPEQRTVANPGPIRQQPIETIGFEDFVCFLLAEEDKRHPTSLEYWFRCVDLDGDGQISLYEMEHFYEGIEQKLMAKNMETLALRDVICNLLDSISPANGYSVTRNDLKRSGLAHRFFNTFVNWIKYVDQESSDGERASVKTTGDKEISDWEVFCLTEYELLMAETEQMSNEGDVEENIDVILDDDDEEAMNLSDEGEHRLNGFLQQKQQQQTSKALKQTMNNNNNEGKSSAIVNNESSQHYSQQMNPSSSTTTAAGESSKKRNRIDSFAAALASRSRTNTGGSRLDLNLSTIMPKEVPPNCHICGLELNNLEEGRKCSICNKIVHANCVDEELGGTFGPYNCLTCRNSPLIGSDSKLYQMPQSAEVGSISEDEEFGGDQSGQKYCDSTGKLGEHSTRDNLNEFYSGFSTPFDDPSPTTASNSIGGSATPTPQPEGTGSDNDEYQPPGANRKSETTRGKGNRGKGKGKKPAAASMESGRQTTMKTRSGGKPPTTSYAAKLATAYSVETGDERMVGQRARGKGSKGKGSCRGRRNTGRGGKLVSMFTSAAGQNGGSRRESGQRENSQETGGAGKRLSPEKNDYIRTAVVTSINDKFIVECPNLCLICGSIGKDSEGAMISCMACAQYFHTYCVSMHDKLNMTLIKRGWRCLDCTVCEGCGSGEDESNLLLCDECDISYHIYCLDPPLGCIPPGSWRCKWCSTCIRCNVQVKAGIDLQRTEGYCQACYSLRKCPKCSQFYGIGDLVLKCQHCLRWFHGRCEGHSNEEQVENAAENAFRCSLCRPQTFNDISNMPIIVDNVMVSKSMVEQIHGIRRFPFFGEHLANISRSFSTDHDEAEMMDDDQQQIIPAGLYSMRGGRGGASQRGAGPGRRVIKLGVGGFTVRNPKSRLLAIGQSGNLSMEDDVQSTHGGTEEDGKQPKIRRPRKLRKPLLEDAYPPNIQESFFGVPAVESRGLADQSVDEPSLNEYKKSSTNNENNKFLSELSEHSAELLRNEQEMDMLGDIPFVDDIGLDMDIENLDFTDLIVGGEDEEEAMMAADNVDSLDDGFNAGSTSSLIQNSAADLCSSSASSNRVPSRTNDPMGHSAAIQNILASHGRQANEQAKPIEQHRLSAAAQAAERWEEDEPLGDKATKAAVLYANVLHPNMKEKFPLWPDRVRQINKVWRELSSEKRQQFVEMARKNRLNCPTPRKRGKRITVFENPTAGQPQKVNEFPVKNLETFNQPQNASIPSNKIPTDSIAGENPTTNLNFMPNPHHQPSLIEMNQSAQFQKRTLELKLQLQMEEDKIAQMKKEKRALAAKQRQLAKQIETIPAEQKEPKEMELKNVEANFTVAKKSVQTQQRVVDKCRQRLKEHQGPQQFPQMPINIQQQFSILQQPSTSTQIVQNQPPYNPSGNELFHRRGTSFEMEQNNLLPLSLGVKQPADLNMQFSSTLTATTTKGQRGRKRKKMRTPMLGGVSFSSLQSTEEMEIYDLVDGMLNIIETNNDGKMAEALFVKRILLSQQQQEQMSTQPLGAMDPLKTKKKRQIAQKGRIASDMNTEVEMLQERVKDSLSMLPALCYSLEQFQSSDKQMLKYPNQTGLPDHPGSESPLREQGIGEFCLPFMSDFYEDLEIPDDEYIDEESLFPPAMDEICADVDLDELEMDTNDAPEEEKYIDFGVNQSKEKSEMLDLDFPFLSMDNIADRSKLVKSTLLLGNNGPDADVPIDPHFSRFEAKPKDFDRQVDIIVDIDPSVLPREELLAHLRQLLGDPNLTAMEIVTPPQTPASPNKQSTSTMQNIIKSAENFEQNPPQKETSSELVCRKCGNSLLAEQPAIEEYPQRIGLIDEKEQKIKFCSMHCYFNFLAQSKIPLDVELLEMAESYVDETTLERLRQISAENFAKRINAVAGGFPSQSSNNFEQMDNLITSMPPSTNQPSTFGMENANFPREVQIRSAELSAILQNTKNAEERKKSGNEFKWRGHGWIKYDFELIQSFQRHHEELKQKFASISAKIFNKMDAIEDTRFCAFCGEVGDGETDQCGRLLNIDANEWVHVNCALWSAEVHVSEEGALMNVDSALRRAKRAECKICGQPGASIRCYKLDCANKDMTFHLLCARSNGFFIKDKTYFCANHEIRPDAIVRLDAIRRLYIHRDENQLLSKIFNHSSPTEMIMRVGSLIFQKIGQLLPDQLRAFTTPDHIFPVGFKIIRFFWSVSNSHENEWMRFECKITDNNGSPEFLVRILDTQNEYRGANPTAAWFNIQHKIDEMRSKTQLLRFFPSLISGETLFGLTEPSISKMLESLPGVDQLFTYTFKHGGTPLMDVPLAENPSGCARCEPCFRTLVKRKHRPIISNSPKKGDEKAYNSSETIMAREGRVRSVSSRFTASTSTAKIDQEMLKAYKASGISERMLQAPYLRNNEAAQLLTQYKEMKKEWKENVYLARSKIQGLGLYAKRDIDMNQFIIEYIGEMIRNEVCEMRQKKYTEQNRGEYMFRIDVDWVVDATMSGGLARYINHSCDPNCGTKILTMNDEKKIVIYANRPIKAGEEFTYDYQFEIEAFSLKIPCLCGAPNCARWMN